MQNIQITIDYAPYNKLRIHIFLDQRNFVIIIYFPIKIQVRQFWQLKCNFLSKAKNNFNLFLIFIKDVFIFYNCLFPHNVLILLIKPVGKNELLPILSPHSFWQKNDASSFGPSQQNPFNQLTKIWSTHSVTQFNDSAKRHFYMTMQIWCFLIYLIKIQH